MTAEPPALGTIGVVATRTGDTMGRLVSWAIRFGTESTVNHAFVYVGDWSILEARPEGSALTAWDAHPGTIWLTNIKPPTAPLAEQQAVARALTGVQYSWLDILAVAIAQKRWDKQRAQQWDTGHSPWWVKRVSSDGQLICSQLCDRYYELLERHLFNDGRLEGLVSPGDLLALNESLGTTHA